MKNYKDYIGETLINKKVRFLCDCIIGMDVRGWVVGYRVEKNEILYELKTEDNRIIKIGENTPGLKIEIY